MAKFIKAKSRWGFHPVYQTQYQNWIELEKAIAAIPDNTTKGDAFEQFCYFYFLYHKELYEIDELWCAKVKGKEIPKEIIEKYKFEKIDFGVDGVNCLVTGEIEAWQAKFHSDRSPATYTELSTFWAEAEYADYRRIISNSVTLPKVTYKKQSHRQTLVDRFLELGGPRSYVNDHPQQE